MTNHYGVCLLCGAPLRPGNAPFTRTCSAADCAVVYAVDEEHGVLTFTECLAKLGISEDDLRKDMIGRPLWDIWEGS